MSANTGQVQPDYFFHKDKISYQAVIQLQRAVTPFLNAAQLGVYGFIIDATARFGRVSTYLAQRHFFEGLQPNGETDFAGILPIPHMSRKSFYKVVNELIDFRLISKEDNKYTIRLDVTPTDLARNEAVQKSVKHRNSHGGMLSTVEGIIEWATKLTEQLLNAVRSFASIGIKSKAWQDTLSQTETDEEENLVTDCANSSSIQNTANTDCSISTDSTNSIQASPKGIQWSKTSRNKVLPYSFHYKNEHLLPDKSGSIMGTAIRDIFMGKRTAAQVIQDIQTSVNHRREKQTAKRRSRRTLADMVALFESNWSRGQRDAGVKVPARIVGKDRALLKNQLLKRVRDEDFDTDDFSYWVTYNWQAIGAQYFERAKSYPEYPAVPWFIKCLETYITAYENKDMLDESGTRSHKELTRRAAVASERAEQTGKDVQSIASKLKEAESEAAVHRARVVELERLLADGGKLDADDLTSDDLDELEASIKKIDTSKLPTFDEDEAEYERSKKPKLKIKRKRK